MRLLLDTHIFIWACSKPHALSADQREAISNPDNDVFVSAASAWEISIKHSLGRLEFPLDRFEDCVSAMGCTCFGMAMAHAIAAGRLPRHHDDPFDRMLIAQAQIEGMTLVTVDSKFQHYNILLF
jgi:PIN domain nuclease of toxin-antitoxin system